MTKQEPTIEEPRQAEVLTLWRCSECGKIRYGEGQLLVSGRRQMRCGCRGQGMAQRSMASFPVIPLEPLRKQLEGAAAAYDATADRQDQHRDGHEAAEGNRQRATALRHVLAYLDSKDTP